MFWVLEKYLQYHQSGRCQQDGDIQEADHPQEINDVSYHSFFLLVHIFGDKRIAGVTDEVCRLLVKEEIATAIAELVA